MWFRIVATVALQDLGPSARPPAAPANGGQVRDQGVEVGDVVDVRGCDMRHQRHPARIGHDVVFGPRLAAIGWVRSSFFLPRIARTDPLSTTVQRWSSRPRRRLAATLLADWVPCFAIWFVNASHDYSRVAHKHLILGKLKHAMRSEESDS